MEPRGALIGPPRAGEAARIWFSVGLPCSPASNGLVGDGALRPAGRNVRKGLGVVPGATVLSGEGASKWEEREGF